MAMAIGFPFLRRFLHSAYRVHREPAIPPDPLILSYFVTFRCNLHCSYCDYVTNRFASSFPEVKTEKAIEILRICRKGIPSVAFSGGEPLVREDIVEIVQEARKLGYRPISLFTNGLELHRKEELLKDLDYLQISMDSVDEDTQDDLRQREGLGARLKDIVRHYARLQREVGFRMNINCVLTPKNVSRVQELMEFALDAGVRFSCSPMLDEKGHAHPELYSLENRIAYQKAIESIIAFKRKTGNVIDIEPYLWHVSHFQPGPCFPTLSPRVYPDGLLRLPCAVYTNATPNVLELGCWENVHQMLKKSMMPCPEPCLLPCYLETSLLVKHPWEILPELRPFKTGLFRRFATLPGKRDSVGVWP